ncbi:MAG: hypothetical protein ACK5QB_20125 [Pseudanabaena sp.]
MKLERYNAHSWEKCNELLSQILSQIFPTWNRRFKQNDIISGVTVILNKSNHYLQIDFCYFTDFNELASELEIKEYLTTKIKYFKRMQEVAS